MNYMSCCGKMICLGCICAVEKGNRTMPCPFCRTPAAMSDEEVMERMNKRIAANDPNAYYVLGCAYDKNGTDGVRRDRNKALTCTNARGNLAVHLHWSIWDT